MTVSKEQILNYIRKTMKSEGLGKAIEKIESILKSPFFPHLKSWLREVYSLLLRLKAQKIREIAERDLAEDEEENRKIDEEIEREMEFAELWQKIINGEALNELDELVQEIIERALEAPGLAPR